jgi:hypothetical protein
VHPIVERFIAGQLPEPMAQTLMGGALPVPPLDLMQALAHAVFTETPYAEKALATAEGMPESLIAGVILQPIDPPAPLQLILRTRKEMDLLDPALLHASMTSAILEYSVPFLPGAALHIVANNQVKWLERPRILDLLEEHPEGDYNLKRRIEEFRFDVLKQTSAEVKAERMEVIDEVEAGHLDKAWADLPLGQEDDEELAKAEAEGREERKALGEDVGPLLDDEGNPIRLSVAQRVAKLRTNQKILLGMKGGKEERAILIREANRLIQVAVIRNGRITEGEIAYISQMRTVNEEVLRLISLNRDWMKKYTIYKNLVMNPKTPLPIAMTHFKRLQEFDIKMIMKDKNVPEMLRREAKRTIEQKNAHRPGG